MPSRYPAVRPVKQSCPRRDEPGGAGFSSEPPGNDRVRMETRRLIPPVLRQLRGDPYGLGRAAQSAHSEKLVARTRTADRVVQSICPYCAVGCGQKVYVKDEKVIQIEGDPDSPISRGRLCPKGSASEKLVNSPMRETRVKYRRPGATDWEYISLDQATDMIADRIIRAREETWEEQTDDGEPLKRTLGVHFLGGATLDSEENYLIKKFFTALGALSIENQARI
jgi:formate dehydrogenase major subunit